LGIQSSHDLRGRAEAATPFSVERRPLAEGCLQIEVGGELDLATTDRLAEALDEALASQANVVVDLQRCSFIDSSGIATILCGRRRLAEEGRDLCVVGARGAVERIFDITGLMASDLVQEDLEAALKACIDSPAAAV
jgi:stage II sporulation protein AA (anti-sigma F factor antagonist)